MEKALIKIVDDYHEEKVKYMVHSKHKLVFTTKEKILATRYDENDKSFEEDFNKAIKSFGRKNKIIIEIERS